MNLQVEINKTFMAYKVTFFMRRCNNSKILGGSVQNIYVSVESKYASIHMVGRSKLFRSTSWQAVLPQIFTRITLLSSLVAIANCLCCLQVFGCFSIVQNTLSEVKYYKNVRRRSIERRNS